MHLSALFIYPVKGLRGIAVDSMCIDAIGPVGDRRFLVVDESGRFLTQRSHARMARVDTALTVDSLILSAEGAGEVVVTRPPDPTAPIRIVSVWKSEGLLAEDCGDAAASWLGDFLSLRCRLVRVGPAFRRPVAKPAARAGDVTAFTDAVPMLLTSEASLAELNDRLQEHGDEPLPMDRFRPNLVVRGGAPFEEDRWERFRIGEIVFRSAGPCARCVVTTTDQRTGERGVEPLRTLATYRRDPAEPTNVHFGQNLIHETKAGTLRIGDALEPV